MLSKESDLILRTRGVSKIFTTAKNQFLIACNDINLNVYRGRTLGIVGESGCGKSTFVRMLMQLEEVSLGSIIYENRDIAHFSKKEIWEHRKNMQMIFQDPYASLNPRMTVGEIIREPMDIHGVYDTKEEREKRVRELLEIVGLKPDHIRRYPHEFSGGQRQRIGIARTLALNPKFIVCDEPISALDVSIQAQVINLLEKIQNEMGIAYLFIAHDLSMVKHISDRIGVMYLGNMVEIGDADDIYHEPLHPYTQALLSSVPIPDPKVARNKKRIVLEGELPSPINPPSGCVFRTRCPKATERCAQEKPALKTVGNRQVACFLYEK